MISTRLISAAMAALVILLSGCASTTSDVDISGKQRTPELFMIVDCLLPPQIRRLGTRITYAAPRRPVKTAASVCEIRGGEYAAYDRADFRTALAVWLPSAQEGSAEAQTYVGEIYEKGLGVAANYELAVQWYQRAADQGNSRALLNLGYLYEVGLGVERDMPTALGYYREASGLTDGDIEYVSSLEYANREAATEKATQLESQVTQLQQQLEISQRRYDEQKTTLEAEQAALETLRQAVQSSRQRVVSTSPSSNSNASATQSLRRIASLTDSLDRARKEQMRLTEKLTSQQLETNRLREQLANSNRETQSTATRQLNERLQAAEQSLNASRQALDRQSDDIRSLTEKNQLERANYELQLASLHQSLANSREEQSRLANSLADTQLSQRAVEQDYARLQSPIQSQNGAKQQNGGKHDQLSARIATLNAEQRLAALELALQEREDAVALRRKQLERLESDVSHSRVKLANRDIENVAGVSNVGLTIDIIEPPLLLTRGAASISLPHHGQVTLFGRIHPAASLLSFQINGQEQPVNNHGVFRFTDENVPGDLNLVAIDNAGITTRLALTVHDAMPGSTLAEQPAGTADQSISGTGSGEASLATHDVEFGKYYALIIGNNNYQSLSTLKTAVNDARAMERLLREKYGFTTQLLLNANRYDMLSALNTLQNTLTENDNLLVYYAGHGELDEESASGYWLPVDADAASAENWIANSAITSMVDAMPAKHVLIVADSCYSGTLTRTAVARQLPTMTAEQRLRWLKAVARSKVRTVLSSGGVKPVLDGAPDERHSIFANVLLDELQTNNNVLEVYKLFFNVQQKVATAAGRLSVMQTPQYAPIRHSGHEAGEFLFVPKNRQNSAEKQQRRISTPDNT